MIENLNSCFDFVDKIDKDDLFNAIIVFSTLMFLWENYLSFRQVIEFHISLKFCKHLTVKFKFFIYIQFLVEKFNKKVPIELANVTDEETFTKSRTYALDKRIYGFINGLYNQIEAYVRIFLNHDNTLLQIY